MSEELINEIADELCDPEFATRKHYSRSTYKDGCNGPLCRKSERDRMRRKRDALKPDRKQRPRPAELQELDSALDRVIDALGLRAEEQAEVHVAAGVAQLAV